MHGILLGFVICAVVASVPALAAPPNTPATPGGPSSGFNDTSYNFTAGPVSDPDWGGGCMGCNIIYQWDWNGDGTSDQDTAQGSGDGTYAVTTAHAFVSTGTYSVKVRAKDDYNETSSWSTALTVNISTNAAPSVPSINSGPTYCPEDTSQMFTCTTSTDPEGDQIKFQWDWDGNGTSDEESGLVSSGTADSRTHTFNTPGTYNVSVRAVDSKGAASSWSTAWPTEVHYGHAPTLVATPIGSATAFVDWFTDVWVRGTDIDAGDTIAYEFDWNNDGSVDETTVLGPPNLLVRVWHRWSSAGIMYYRVRVIDNHGVHSSWSMLLSIGVSMASVGIDYATDNPYSWSLGGEVKFIGQGVFRKVGYASAQSGKIEDNQKSTIRTGFGSDTLLGFLVKTSTADSGDYFRVDVEGTEVPGTRLYGENDWKEMFVKVLGGQSIEFIYTKDGSVSGGLDAIWVDRVQVCTPISGDICVSPAVVTTGDNFTVSYTFTPAGQAVDVYHAIQVNVGNATLLSSPPTAPIMCAAGVRTTWSWTCKANASGPVNITVSVYGHTVSYDAPVWSTNTVTRTVLPRAVLVSDGAVTRSVDYIGENVEVVLTVSNTGDAAANNVLPQGWISSGASLVAPVTGPSPAGPVTINGGGSQKFTWVFTCNAKGAVTFTATVMGVDASLAVPVGTGDSASLIILKPAQFTATPYVQTPVSIGMNFNLVLVMTNIGEARSDNNLASLQVNSGGALASYVSGPTPAASFNIWPGETQAYTWAYSAKGSGTVEFTMTVVGVCSGTGAKPIAGGTRTCEVQTPANLVAGQVDAIPVFDWYEGDYFTVRAAFNNTGQAKAVGVTASPVLTIDGSDCAYSIRKISGPSGPTTVNGVSSAQFTWVYEALAHTDSGSACLAGSFHWYATIAGADGNSGLAVTTGSFCNGGATMIGKSAALRGTLSLIPDKVMEGQDVVVRYAVSNKGSYGATAVTPKLIFNPALADLASGPVPSSVNLSANGGGSDSVVFEWLLQTKRAGTLGLSATVTGMDAINTTLKRFDSTTASVTIVERFAEQSAVYPNPVVGDVATVGFHLDDNAEEITVVVLNSGMQKVYEGTWKDVTQVQGAVKIEGVLKWAPGVYLVKAKAKLRGGKNQDFPVVRLAVKR